MDTYKVKWTKLQAEIFRFLSISSGKSFNLRGLAKFLNVSPTAASNALSDLEKDEFVKVKRSETMNLLTIEFNRDSRKAIDLKRVENLKQIYESGLVWFLEEKFPGNTIILFGSYSRGEDVHNSDVDIAIVGTKGKDVDLGKFEKVLEKTIHVNFYKSWELDKNLRANILNGIVLIGGIEL